MALLQHQLTLFSLSFSPSFLTMFLWDIKGCWNLSSEKWELRWWHLHGQKGEDVPSLQREAGESVPCIRGLMRDLPDQRVRKTASKKLHLIVLISAQPRRGHHSWGEMLLRLLFAGRSKHQVYIYNYNSIWKLISIKYWKENKKVDEVKLYKSYLINWL